MITPDVAFITVGSLFLFISLKIWLDKVSFLTRSFRGHAGAKNKTAVKENMKENNNIAIAKLNNCPTPRR